MPNTQKQDFVQNLREKVQKAKSITFVDYLGLSANAITDFRQKITKLNGETIIAKNTLLKIALKDEGMAETSELKGPTAAIFSYDDPISAIKTIYEFAGQNELPKVKFSFVEKTYTTESNLKILSTLPSREELIARVVGRMKSPLNGVVNVFGGTQRKFVTVLSRIAESKS